MASNMRIGGLASGMDIDQMVSDLMKAERVPLDKLTQKKQYMEWRRDDYRDMNKSLLELDQLTFDGVMKQGSYVKKSITISDSEAISIKNINSTIDFSGSIEVVNLAKAATMYSKSSSGITNPSAILGTSIAAQKITIKAIDKNGVLETRGTEITIDPTKDTLDSIIEKINANSGVSAFYDKQTGKLSLIAKNSGETTAGTEIELSSDLASGTAGHFWETLKLDATNTIAAQGVPPSGSDGLNATIKYNGMEIKRSSNNFNINGVEFTAKKATTSPVTFSSTPDVDAILETIVKFVDKYNTTIEKIQDKLDEKRYRDYQPLTKEQREAMDDKTIELWEEKAKSGTLRGDSILSSALTKMRTSLYSSVTSIISKNQLSKIGITTSGNYLEGGKLIVDPDKLKAAISEDPNAVYELFAKDGDTTGEKGLARRLRDDIKATMGDIEQKAGKASSVNYTFVLGRNLDSLDNQISRFEDRLTQVEDRYWRQFTAMEKAISKSNNQATYLMQQFGGGN
ncbi:flagellar hook-associated protein 2 [Neobacillus sp. D3-1R]|uniref:flagellar hook-associated protein 2 n=1 Tax=Neobacillus sp. D3-1R TaxID=3445778 RepID=UPI003FA149B2